MNTTRFLCLILISFALTQSAIPQGSLTPPPGAPAPTMKTLDQLQPRTPVNATTTPGDATSVFKITQPGSYYLTGNIAGVSGKHGISITTGNVTLDLMGFELVGVAGSLDGIHVDNLGTSINYAVCNGTVRNWGGNGLNLNVQGRHRISDVRALNNGAAGISCANRGVIEGCVATGNALQGIAATADIVSNSAAGSNGGVGIQANVVTDCSSSSNTGDGILASNGAVTHCVATVNGGAGIVGDFGTVITGCSVIASTGNGITLDEGSIAVDCYVRGNHAIGISATIGSRIAGCTSKDNDGAGIHINSSDCRVEGNNVTDNDRGIDVDVLGNLILRNSASGNTSNYEIVAGNSVSAIVVPAASAAISGNGAFASSLGTTDPWANFSY